ncbi:MAG: insulinase family protein [Spirochaetales bacterium]|nr:insulinase family protein [Spirochaetales bacterium]
MLIHDIKKIRVGSVNVLLYQNSSFLTSIQILTRAGSTAEAPGQEGLAHILEHMFFKGSQKRPGPLSISRAANDIGGKLNAYTSYDHTCYFITVLNENFETGLDILSDMYLHPLFPEEELKKEISPILSELREREDEPDAFLSERALESYLGTAYHPIIGRPETIAAASLENVRAFHENYYGGDNVLLVISGGVEENRALDAVARLFHTHSVRPPPDLPVFAYQPGSVELSRPGLHEGYFHLYFPALPLDHPDRTTEDVMNYVLGGNDSSLLFERIREELGLSCYGIYSFTSRFEGLALAGITCGIDPAQLSIMEKEVYRILERLCTTEIEESLLLRMKAALKTSFAQRSETSDGMASMIGVPALRGEEGHPVKKALENIEAVTPADIKRHAARLFQQESFRAVLLPA